MQEQMDNVRRNRNPKKEPKSHKNDQKHCNRNEEFL